MLISREILAIILSIGVALVPVTLSECQQSHITTCDNFQDFTNYGSKAKMKEVIIGSDVDNYSSISLMETLQLQAYPRLTTLTILRRISGLKSQPGFRCNYQNSPLKYVSFYGNDIKSIQSFHFPTFPLKRLTLVNNGIETIKKHALNYHPVEELDLSENFLEVVEKDSLPMTNSTRIIAMKKNKLMHIEPGSFPPSIKSLHLDNNSLRFIQKEVFSGLDKLRELTLSHNKFNEIPDLRHLKKLVVLDLSHNTITTISKGTFEDIDNLQLLDLSNNKLANSADVRNIFGRGKHASLTVSLALNELRELELQGAAQQRQTLVLYGNPFHCDDWKLVQLQMVGHESECDGKLLSDGTTPFCIGFEQSDFFFSTQWLKEIAKFHGVVRSRKLPYSCDMEAKADLLLRNVIFGCVA